LTLLDTTNKQRVFNMLEMLIALAATYDALCPLASRLNGDDEKEEKLCFLISIELSDVA
jgi:hypothetical protein